MRVCVLLSLALLLVVLVGGRAVGDEPAPDTAAALRLVDRLTKATPVDWSEADLAALRRATRLHPRATITRLVERLQVDQAVPPRPFESVFHSVCGNALTLLDRLTSEQVGGTTKDWIGFATRDHRGRGPDAQTVYGPWRAWLKVREDIPVEKWFWGLSYAELEPVVSLVRKGEGQWGADAVARVRALGTRVYPYLLDKLTDNGYAGGHYRVCDRANALLRRLTGHDLGELVRHEHMRLSFDDERRTLPYAIRENQASMALFQRRWMERLLVGD